MGQAAHYRVGDEPVPGYQLKQFLGRGGFGEVWKAAGPGGVMVAMKIIYDLDRKRGGKELKALRLLRDIRHPNLIPLTGFWLKTSDGELVSTDSVPDLAFASADTRGTIQISADTATAESASSAPAELVIAMGLAEKSLFDRLQERRDEGKRGVPADELLTYIEDAARAIDLLNIKHGIEHCDIKPQNILLLSGAAQVCDFGLAKMVGEVRETSMGAGTIAYGAPEVLLGKGPTATTDQYSLAISYFELRTGELPFASERISDVLGAKQDGTMDLSLLPRAERQVIERAVAINPIERFNNCGEMVKALRACATNEAIPAPVGSETSSRAETQINRTTVTRQRFAIRRRRLWSRVAIGTLTAGVVLGGVAYLTMTAMRNNEAATEKLAEAEGAFVFAEHALERANQLNTERSHETDKSTATTPAAAPAVETPKPDSKPSESEPPKWMPGLQSEPKTTAPVDPAPVKTAPVDPIDVAPVPVEPATVDPTPIDPVAFPAPMESENATASSATAPSAATEPQPPAPVVEVPKGEPATASETTPPQMEPSAEQYPSEPHNSEVPQQISAEPKPVVTNPEAITAQNPQPSPNSATVAKNPEPRKHQDPVRLSGQLTNDSWIVTISITETAKEIWYRCGERGDFESTGFQDFLHDLSGSRHPKKHFVLPLTTSTSQVFVKYTDHRGNLRGPFEVTFNPEQQRTLHAKQILNGFPLSWISFGKLGGQPVAYFTHLLSQRNAVREIRYSIDSDLLDQSFPLPWSESAPHSIPADAKNYIELPAGAQYVRVQLTFQDGETSKVQRFDAK